MTKIILGTSTLFAVHHISKFAYEFIQKVDPNLINHYFFQTCSFQTTIINTLFSPLLPFSFLSSIFHLLYHPPTHTYILTHLLALVYTRRIVYFFHFLLSCCLSCGSGRALPPLPEHKWWWVGGCGALVTGA